MTTSVEIKNLKKLSVKPPNFDPFIQAAKRAEAAFHKFAMGLVREMAQLQEAVFIERLSHQRSLGADYLVHQWWWRKQ